MILASVITYELSKRIGITEATKLFAAESSGSLTSSDKVCVPAVHVVRRLRTLTDVATLHDAGGTSIGHARSRAFGVATKAARAEQIDAWISIDDDMTCSTETLQHLLGAIIDHDEPQIVIVPYWLRQEVPVVAITLDDDNRLERITHTGARLRRATHGGMGIVAITRAAILELAAYWKDLTFVDYDGEERVGIFCEFIRNGIWHIDDYAFFSRVPAHIRVEALLTGATDHDGRLLELETVEQHPHIPRPRGFERRDTEPPPLVV